VVPAISEVVLNQGRSADAACPGFAVVKLCTAVGLALLVLLCTVCSSTLASQSPLTEADFQGSPKDVVLWGELARVGVSRREGRFVPTFLPPVIALDGKSITLVGYMTPLQKGEDHKQFLLSDRPILCGHCSPPAPAAIVEVNLKTSEWRRERPIMVRGKLQLVRDVPGLFYRLNEGVILQRPPRKKSK
jgi:hypothetical protein